jgi:hypothetical protein
MASCHANRTAHPRSGSSFIANGLKSKAQSQGVRSLGLRRSRYRGLSKTHLRPKDEKISLRTINVLTFTVITTDPNEVVQHERPYAASVPNMTLPTHATH